MIVDVAKARAMAERIRHVSVHDVVNVYDPEDEQGAVLVHFETGDSLYLTAEEVEKGQLGDGVFH